MKSLKLKKLNIMFEYTLFMLSDSFTNITGSGYHQPKSSTYSVFWILINIIVSLIIIYGIHAFWNYLKDTYSTKKTKDLVGSQIQKYKKMVDEIQQNRANIPGSPTGTIISEKDQQSMNDELMEYVNSVSINNNEK